MRHRAECERPQAGTPSRATAAAQFMCRCTPAGPRLAALAVLALALRSWLGWCGRPLARQDMDEAALEDGAIQLCNRQRSCSTWQKSARQGVDQAGLEGGPFQLCRTSNGACTCVQPQGLTCFAKPVPQPGQTAGSFRQTTGLQAPSQHRQPTRSEVAHLREP